jgi:hypothetical protein
LYLTNMLCSKLAAFGRYRSRLRNPIPRPSLLLITRPPDSWIEVLLLLSLQCVGWR